jgi:hypothetical protein
LSAAYTTSDITYTATADGNTTTASTKIDFTFSAAVTGLTASDITYTDQADGNTTTASTKITFTFSGAVTGLTANDIVIGGTPGAATKGAVTGNGTSWSLAITTTTAGAATVSITKSGVETGTKNITLYKPTTSSDGVTITQPGAGEADPVLSVSPAEPPNGYSANFTITAPTGYTSYKWLLDGAVQTGQMGNTFPVTVSGLSDGNHSVTVVVVKNGKDYSATRNFTVSN